MYNRVITEMSSPSRKLEALWRWKGLNRPSFEYSEVAPYLEDAKELCDEIEGGVPDRPVHDITAAFVELRDRMTNDGPLSPSSTVIVTPQFLLHLADSDGEYSGRFPILDVMVARAYRTRTEQDPKRTLQYSLTGSRASYRELVEYFLHNCETSRQVAYLERALFVQGRAIGRYQSIQSGDEREYTEVGKIPVSGALSYLKAIEHHTQL